MQDLKNYENKIVSDEVDDETNIVVKNSSEAKKKEIDNKLHLEIEKDLNEARIKQLQLTIRGQAVAKKKISEELFALKSENAKLLQENGKIKKENTTIKSKYAILLDDYNKQKSESQRTGSSIVVDEVD